MPETMSEKLERLRSRLTYEQRVFCEEYVKTCDARQAAATAFGGKANASRPQTLLGKWYIQDYLKLLTDAYDPDDMIVTQGEVLAHLADILRGHGEDKDRVSAAKVISQIRGFQTKKVVHSNDPKNPVPAGLTAVQITQMRATFLGIDPKVLEAAE